MEESENSFLMQQQRLKSCSGTTSSSTSSIPIHKPALDLRGGGSFRNFPQSPESSSKRGPGIPPAHPHFPPLTSHLQQQQQQQIPKNFLLPTPPPSSHSRSLSQPAFFSLDCLPHFNAPSPPSVSDPSSSADVAMEDRGPAAVNSRAAPPPVPAPRKLHRRSQSDVPFDFRLAGLPPLPHQGGFLNHLVSPRDVGSVRPHSVLVKQESDWDRDGIAERKSDGDAAGDDLFSAYMNLDSLDTLNSSGNEEKREDLDSRASGNKTGGESSENEAESSSVNECGSSSSLQLRREGNKRSAAGNLVPPVNFASSRHCRSVSVDSFVGKLSFTEESPKLLPSPGPVVSQHSQMGPMDGTTSAFSLEFGNGEFSGAELKKIMANEKLAEIAMADPKRAKRILANRQSAARSKERKMRYISELEHKVQTLQTEATTLSAQLTLLQRDSAGLTNQNNELKFRLQAMEQQAHLRDALNEALTAEVQRLKLVTGESQLSNSLNQQMQLNPQMFQMQQVPKQQQQQQQQQQQSSQTPHFQIQAQQQSQQQQQKNNDGSKNDTNK